MIEPNPANPVEEFHAASVYTEHSPDRLRFGSILINVSEEKYLEGLEPTSILQCQRLPFAESLQVCEISLLEDKLTVSQPSRVDVKALALIALVTSASSQIFVAQGQLNGRCVTDSTALRREQRVVTGMLRIGNCSPTGRTPCRDFQMKILAFSDVLMFRGDR